MRLLSLLSLLLYFTAISIAVADERGELTSNGISLSDKNFPWPLVIDRGKILGCVYDNTFYSLGAVLILESLPRKCEMASDRNGIWEQLSEAEMLIFQESIEKQQQAEQQTIYIGSEPINDEEARLIRYLRNTKKQIDTR